jgi:hypothetical protein
MIIETNFQNKQLVEIMLLSEGKTVTTKKHIIPTKQGFYVWYKDCDVEVTQNANGNWCGTY